MFRKCSKCNEFVGISLFHKYRGWKGRTTIYPFCRACVLADKKVRYRLKHPSNGSRSPIVWTRQKFKYDSFREYYAVNKVEFNRRKRERRRNNPVLKARYLEQNRGYKLVRNAQKRAAGGSFTVKEWCDLLDQWGHICLCCKRPDNIVKLCADHIVPVSRNGTSYISNIQPLCGSCNSSKRDKTIDYRRP